MLLETKSGGIDAIATLLVRSLKCMSKFSRNVWYDFQHSSALPYKEETNLIQHPIGVNRQLGLTLYRLGHGASFTTLSQLFGVSISLASVTFNKVCRVFVATLYNIFVKLPRTIKEWEAELKAFLENYEFPYVGAWDGFHVYAKSKLKSYFSFKKRYSMSDLGLVSYNMEIQY